MMVWGSAFLPPHSLVAAVDGTRYRLYYLSGDSDATATGASLRQFLDTDSYLLAVLLVNKAATLVQFSRLLRSYARRVYAIVVYDSLTELTAHSIPLLDGSRTEQGWWRKPGAAAELLSEKLLHHRSTLKLSRLHRRAATMRARPKTRGQLAKFAAVVSTVVPGQKRITRLLRVIFGRLVGTVAATDCKAALATLRTRYKLPEAAIDELLHYQHSPKGGALHHVFYRMQQGDDFRELQIKFKHLDLDDWLVVNEIWSAVEPHTIVTRPK